MCLYNYFSVFCFIYSDFCVFTYILYFLYVSKELMLGEMTQISMRGKKCKKELAERKELMEVVVEEQQQKSER